MCNEPPPTVWSAQLEAVQTSECSKSDFNDNAITSMYSSNQEFLINLSIYLSVRLIPSSMRNRTSIAHPECFSLYGNIGVIYEKYSS